MATSPLGSGDDVLSFGGLDGTPRLLPRNHGSPTRYINDFASNLSLRLTSVIGNTVSSVNGFSWTPAKPWFAICAGSVIALHIADQDCNLTQRFFRARPTNTNLPNGVDNATPTRADLRRSQVSSLRTSNIGLRTGAASPSSDNQTTPSKAASRMGTRSSTCVAISPNGQLLAAGETGYSPRILLFSAAENTSGFPYATLSEHSFGVKCIAFSPDSRWLCSVGDIYDSFIMLWSLNSRNLMPKLHATNRCTSTIYDVTWMGKSIITVGTRHIKVWRPEFPTPSSPAKTKFRAEAPESPSTPGSKPLSGRNTLLGQLLESTFTCVQAISDTKAVIGTDKGDVCLLDDTGGAQKLFRVLKLPFGVNSVAVDPSKEEIWIAGTGYQTHRLIFDDMEGMSVSNFVSDSQNEAIGSPKAYDPALATGIVALGLLPNALVSIDSDHHITLQRRHGNSDQSQLRHIQSYRSHQGAVLGAHSLQSPDFSEPGFMTFDSTGSLMFWNRVGSLHSGHKVPLDQMPFSEETEVNELKIVRHIGPGTRLVSGDKYGFIRLLDGDDWNNSVPIKAHQGEVNDIAVCQYGDGSFIVGSCGRDRVIQILDCLNDTLNLIQTIDQHGSSVQSMLFIKNGEMLLSASSDRTVGVFALARTDESKAYIAVRILTLKQTPISLTPDSTDENTIMVATMDKQLHIFDLDTGQCLSTSRLSDDKSSTSIVLSSTAVRSIPTGWNAIKTVIGVSPTDKSIRVHDLESGSTLLRDYGHSEGVSSAAVIAEPQDDEPIQTYKLVSTGLDGTIMIWELSYSPRTNDTSLPSSPVRESPTLAQPLRRVLSRSQLADFTRSLEANGISPVSTNPSRGPSPSRLRRRVSAYSLGTASPKLTPTPRLRRPERSPSPPSPATPSSATFRKTFSRTKSVGNFNDLNYSAEQLSKSLRQFRKKLNTSQDVVSHHAVGELEHELSATLKSMVKLTKRHPRASDNNVGDLLDQYSDRLAELVERKISLGAAGEKKVDTAATVKPTVLDNGRVSPSKLDAVKESPETK